MTIKWILYVDDKAEFNNMNKDGNDVSDNSEENENEFERNSSVQRNIYCQLLENLSLEEALALFSL